MLATSYFTRSNFDEEQFILVDLDEEYSLVLLLRGKN